MKKTDMKDVLRAARELSAVYGEAGTLMKGSVEEMRSFRSLWGNGLEGPKSGLVKLGIALFLFPEPTLISDVIGCGMIAAGLAYSRIRPPPIYIGDVYSMIEKEIEALRKGA